MSTISDFFSITATSKPLTTTRVTHGTTCSIYTFGCCSCCCFCIPQASSTTQKWTYEMWGQGGGGGSGCCCYYSPYGGGGGQYGAARQSRSTAYNLTLGLCACSCWCCYYNGMEGHPGQFSRICESNSVGWTMSSGGGYRGWTCCFYLWNYPSDCNIDRAVLAFSFMPTAFGGGGGAQASCRFKNLVPSTQNDGSACQGLGNPIVCLPIIANQASPTLTSGSLPGSYTSIGNYFDAGGCCQCGTHSQAIWNCEVNERICYNGSCGYAAGSMGQSNVQSNNYLGIGIGGAGYSGANAQPYHSCSATWTWAGCMGNVPGGGGSSGGGCQGSCCYGSVGGAGLVIVSYDN